MPQKAVKGQALADFLAAHPLPVCSPLNDELPDEQILEVEEKTHLEEWELYFDGASSIRPARPPKLPTVQVGIGLIFVTPQGGILRYSYSLIEPRTNNEAEYEALIAGLELAINMQIVKLRIHGDSQLIIKQIDGAFQIHKPELIPYRGENGKADALAKLAKEMANSQENPILITIQNRHALAPASLQDNEGKETLESFHISDESDWREPFITYFKEGRLPDDKSIALQISKRALRYAYVNNTLYRRSFDQMWLRCLGPDESQKVITEVHEGLCGAHQSGPKMKIKIKRMGDYWPNMVKYCLGYAKKCHQCQVHTDVIHRPPNPIHPTVASWPFESWGTHIIGPIEPPSSLGHRFILAATDYFSKWAEAIPLREVKTDNVMKFFRDNIVYRFGVPHPIISDNGTALKSAKIYRFIESYKIG
ncbi:uncharacterized protein LOC114579513 [Dendrobium catenatum]|uniref:uncharacterized protein LOC114579513 n=1 Tax=Dendrobium catenatum TaxID=906689 RepID=UPI0010A0AC10|nr:uncharacterized protein LOC114579513 [Dendrobium catenatum]